MTPRRAPATRSTAAGQAETKADQAPVASTSRSGIHEIHEHDADDGGTIERYLGNVRSGVKRLKETVKDLRAEIVTLKEDNAALLEVRSSPSIQTYELAVESVSFSRVRENKKRKARLDKIRTQELRREAAALSPSKAHDSSSLLPTAGGGSHDVYKLRLILKRFEDLMTQNTLEGDKEECAICLDTMKPGQCGSLPCDHLVCLDCIPSLERETVLRSIHDPSLLEDIDIDMDVDPDAPITVFRCPHCRRTCMEDEVQKVEMTAADQWGALTDLATVWARLDEEDDRTIGSDELESTPFIDDGDEEEQEGMVTPIARSPAPAVPPPSAPSQQTTSSKKRRIAVTDDDDSDSAPPKLELETPSRRRVQEPQAPPTSAQKRQRLEDMAARKAAKPVLY